MNRKPNRTIEEISQDVESTEKIVREDIYDILNSYKTREEARRGLLDFVDQNSMFLKKIYPEYTVQQIAVRLTSDMDTYKVDWGDDAGQ